MRPELFWRRVRARRAARVWPPSSAHRSRRDGWAATRRCWRAGGADPRARQRLRLARRAVALVQPLRRARVSALRPPGGGLARAVRRLPQPLQPAREDRPGAARAARDRAARARAASRTALRAALTAGAGSRGTARAAANALLARGGLLRARGRRLDLARRRRAGPAGGGRRGAGRLRRARTAREPAYVVLLGSAIAARRDR